MPVATTKDFEVMKEYVVVDRLAAGRIHYLGG